MFRTVRVLAIATLACGVAACSDDTTSSSTVSPTSAATSTSSPTSTSSGSADVSSRIDQASEALSRGDFSTMLQILSLSSIGKEIEDRAVTILSPTNDAFGAMSADEQRDLLTNPTKIDDVLRRHVLEGALTIDDLRGKTEVTTIGGDKLPVTVSGDTVMIDGATLTPVDQSNASTDQGQDLVVYSIDRVLLPS